MFDLLDVDTLEALAYSLFFTLSLFVIITRIRACWIIRQELSSMLKDPVKSNDWFSLLTKHNERTIVYYDFVAEIFIISITLFFIM